MWERPRTNGNGSSTSRRSRVRYAPCPVNSSTDAGKGDLLYPVPDPTPGVEVHDSTWQTSGKRPPRLTRWHEPLYALRRRGSSASMICVPIPGDSRKVTWYISWTLPTQTGMQKTEFPMEGIGSSGGEEAGLPGPTE